MSEQIAPDVVPAAIDVILALADDEHLMGQQHTEWIGVAPTLEEDLAFSSIGQDELGHAAMLYELVLELRGVEVTDATVDNVAYHRSAEDYRSSAFAEYTTDDWAETLVRHWVYDSVEELRWAQLAESALTVLSEITVRASREETYHRLHADALLDQLLTDGEARSRILTALDVILGLVPSLLAPPPGEAEAIAAGVANGSLADLAEPLRQRISERFDVSVAAFAGGPDRREQRSGHFEPLMTRMREVFEFDPEAVW